MKQNLINHIALVLDASGSMDWLTPTVIKVADAQIRNLADLSRERDQETRVSIYTFSYHHNIRCVVYDKDVLRLPSIASFYRPDGQTALIDATLRAIEDLEKTATLYGDHAFLLYVLTDGIENNSRRSRGELDRKLRRLGENWTAAAFVPNVSGRFAAEQMGFASGNITIWEASEAGTRVMGETIRSTMQAYMSARETGLRGTTSLFSMAQPSPTEVKKNLTELHPGQYRVLTPSSDTPIAQLVEQETKRAYTLGEAYYQLVKRERIQSQKRVALVDRKTYRAYVGDEARKLMKLPNYVVRVSPNTHPQYDVYVQSTSTNRKVLAGQRVLVMS